MLSFTIIYILNLVLTFVISKTIFAMILRALPDARISWGDVISGTILTAVLFMLGKFEILLYISQTKIGSTFGRAGSIIILREWIYYS